MMKSLHRSIVQQSNQEYNSCPLAYYVGFYTVCWWASFLQDKMIILLLTTDSTLATTKAPLQLMRSSILFCVYSNRIKCQARKGWLEGFSLEEKEKEFENFLFHIIDQDYNKAFRRNRSDFGRKYEKKARITNKYYNYLLQINSLVHRIKRR